MQLNKLYLIPLIIAVAAIAMIWVAVTEMPIVYVFIPGIILSYLIFIFFFSKKTPTPEKILPFYLLLLGFQFLHFTEEYLANFEIVVPAFLGQKTYSQDYWVTFNMVAYFIFILGGIVIHKRIKELMIIPIFFIFVGVLLNSVVHILVSIFVGGYFPGLYTAIIYAILGPFFIKRVLEDMRTTEKISIEVNK